MTTPYATTSGPWQDGIIEGATRLAQRTLELSRAGLPITVESLTDEFQQVHASRQHTAASSHVRSSVRNANQQPSEAAPSSVAPDTRGSRSSQRGSASQKSQQIKPGTTATTGVASPKGNEQAQSVRSQTTAARSSNASQQVGANKGTSSVIYHSPLAQGPAQSGHTKSETPTVRASEPAVAVPSPPEYLDFQDDPSNIRQTQDFEAMPPAAEGSAASPSRESRHSRSQHAESVRSGVPSARESVHSGAASGSRRVGSVSGRAATQGEASSERAPSGAHSGGRPASAHGSVRSQHQSPHATSGSSPHVDIASEAESQSTFRKSVFRDEEPREGILKPSPQSSRLGAQDNMQASASVRSGGSARADGTQPHHKAQPSPYTALDGTQVYGGSPVGSQRSRASRHSTASRRQMMAAGAGAGAGALGATALSAGSASNPPTELGVDTQDIHPGTYGNPATPQGTGGAPGGPPPLPQNGDGATTRYEGLEEGEIPPDQYHLYAGSGRGSNGQAAVTSPGQMYSEDGSEPMGERYGHAARRKHQKHTRKKPREYKYDEFGCGPCFRVRYNFR